MRYVRHLAVTVLLDITNGDVDKVSRIVGLSRELIHDRYGHLCDRAEQDYDVFNDLVSKRAQKVVSS